MQIKGWKLQCPCLSPDARTIPQVLREVGLQAEDIYKATGCRSTPVKDRAVLHQW